MKKAEWSGEQNWALVSYPVTAGNHLFQWQYIKDLSVDTGSDKAWVDDICFPTDNTAIPNLSVTPETIYIELPMGSTLDSNITLTSTTPIYAIFTNTILDTINNPVNWCTSNYPNGSVNGLQSRQIQLSFNTRNKVVGEIYLANMTTTVTDGNQVITPIQMKVVSGLGIDENSNSNLSSVYPNPTTDLVTISNKNQLIHFVQLFDVNGKLLWEQSVNQNMVDLHLQNLSSGIYFVKIRTENQAVQNVKVIKN